MEVIPKMRVLPICATFVLALALAASGFIINTNPATVTIGSSAGHQFRQWNWDAREHCWLCGRVLGRGGDEIGYEQVQIRAQHLVLARFW